MRRRDSDSADLVHHQRGDSAPRGVSGAQAARSLTNWPFPGMMCDSNRSQEGENEKQFSFTAGEEGESPQQHHDL
jgi:hypothetical protein